MPHSCNHSYLSYLVLTGKDIVALATFTGRGGPAWCTSVETTAGGGLGWDACSNLSLEAYENCCIFAIFCYIYQKIVWVHDLVVGCWFVLFMLWLWS